MLVDDAGIFDDVGLQADLQHSPAYSSSLHPHSISDAQRANATATATILVEQRSVANHVMAAMSHGGNRTASIDSLIAAAPGSAENVADDGDGVPPLQDGPEHILGFYAAHGPKLSWAVRERLRASLEREAPDDALANLRALARVSGQTGISAWRTYRDMERRQQRQRIPFFSESPSQSGHPGGSMEDYSERGEEDSC